MKKYICKTAIPGLYVKGEVYKLNEEDRIVRAHVRLGYLEQVPMNYKKKGGNKK